MTALFIARVDIKDKETYTKYLQAVPPIISRYGGKPVVRTEQSLTLEGPAENRRIIVLEFPSVEKVKEFYNSEEYRQVRKIRENAAIGEIIVVETV
jgi:uncharacterized protein (DUF1330 family)